MQKDAFDYVTPALVAQLDAYPSVDQEVSGQPKLCWQHFL